MNIPAITIFALLAVVLPCKSQAQALPDPLDLYDRFDGELVRVQGLAWIQFGVKSNIVLLVTPHGQIWLESPTHAGTEVFRKWNGKLIEVSGTLNKEELLSMPPRDEKLWIYRMEDYVIRGIDRVEVEINQLTEQGAAPKP
ncbi:hypothetical protein JIN85_19705 [Luteolibacter pohnpeiensis]|uniref:Uncharacterized protein n=1 Tax=Luteolibacter pohnpeiensis TaxID=454153 RepID=A0A934S8E0_9BACT|nr:hypothetical protein [Luteolibacter pohnpeiensis]MBK1884651.1 hypothetical protein [Luteolibacter pohnpeiensis]